VRKVYDAEASEEGLSLPYITFAYRTQRS